MTVLVHTSLPVEQLAMFVGVDGDLVNKKEKNTTLDRFSPELLKKLC